MTEVDQAWLDAHRDAGTDLPGATAGVEYVVARGKKEDDLVFHVQIEDGRVAGAALGSASEPDFTMLMPMTEFDEVVAGTLDPKVGYMQGRIKVTGNVGRMLSVLPVLSWMQTP